MNIDFHPDGTFRCLWTEVIPLEKLGRLKISRATNVEFNEKKQRWEVRDLKDKKLFDHVSRAACLRWEENNIF